MCRRCRAVQLTDEVPREKMFHDEYPFRTSSSAWMSSHFAKVAAQLVDTLRSPDPFVVEIGCNDGTMLETFAERGIRHLGIDPAANLVAEAGARGVLARPGFFEPATAAEIRAEHGPAEVVYAANTMCHIPYLDEIFAGLDALLGDDGILVFEDPYLGDVLRLGSYDQLYDEHFYLFSATSVACIAESHGFALIDVEHIGVHGGELRYTVGRRDRRRPTPAVDRWIAGEASEGVHDLARLASFAAEIGERRDRLRRALQDERAAGRSIAGYAATAKSATVLNYCGIGPDLLPVIYDTTPEKQGRLTPGSGIPVEPFPTGPDGYPDTFLLFAWNHAEEIMAKEQEFVARGGRWIRYVPDVLVG